MSPQQTVHIQLESPSASISAVSGQQAGRLAEQRRALAESLRNQYPGQWAVISRGHTTIKSAGVVRRRLLEQAVWQGFEMTSRKDAATGTSTIYGRFVGTAAARRIADKADAEQQAQAGQE
jgi:hypothetical protein